MFRFFDEILTKSKLGFSLDMFRSTFIHLAHLSTTRPSSMVFEHL
jgi:hypothetical protein